MIWNPNEIELQTLISLFQNATKGDVYNQQKSLKQLEQFSAVPEFNNYLCFIFTSKESEEIRSIAGLLLKNNLPDKWASLSSDILEYCKMSVLKALSDQSEMVKKVSGSIITRIVSSGLAWPDLVPRLLSFLRDENICIGALSALEKICEDSADRLDRESPELVSQMLQQIVALSESPNADIRASVVNSVNQFLLIRSNQVWNHLDSFLQILYNMTNDSSLKVKRYVCQAFNHILELDPEVILPVLNSVVEFMLVNTLNEDKELALEAADFWLVFCEQETMHIHLQQFLPRVVPILLTCMIYTEDDLYMLEQQGEDFDVEDKDQDIKPRFHKGKTHELSNNQIFPDEDEEDSDLDAYEDYDDEWNVRKSSAAALDTLSTVFGDDFLPDLLPKINEMLQHPDWKTKEASILAIGAIAQGCVNGMIPHLPGLIPHLVNLLNHEKPLIRSITAWTLSRYSSWICNTSNGNHDHYLQYLLPILEGLLRLCLDKNKEVQKSGCSALVTIEEDAKEALIPFLDPIIATLSKAFLLYQRKNLLILYDTIGTLAEAVGNALNQPKYIGTIMPLLLQKYDQCEDDNFDLFSILECFGSLSVALGTGFSPYCANIWQRCLRLVRNCLCAVEAYKQDPANNILPDKDIIVVSLDLIGAIVQGLGGTAEGLLLDPTEPTIFTILKLTMNDETADVRSCSFALVGDIAINCFRVTVPHINDFINLACANIDEKADFSRTSSMNNACWSVGEIAVRYDAQMAPYVTSLLMKLVPLMLNRSIVRSLLENSSITIGRLAKSNPQLIAPHYHQFLGRWLEILSNISDNHEKQEAVMGVCAVLKQNPVPIFENFVEFVNMVSSKNDNPHVKNEIYEVLGFLRGQIKPEDWDILLGKLGEGLRERFRLVYGF